MVKPYPHTMVLVTNADSTQDENGNWLPGAANEEETFDCRAEDSGGGYISKADGQKVDYSWVVYGKTLPILKPGQLVKVMDGAREIFTDTVKQFYKGQLTTRVWL